MRSKTLFRFFSTAAFALISSAHAADLAAAGGYRDDPSSPVSTWTGFYAGVSGGYGWNSNDQNLTIADYKPASIAVGQFGTPQSDGGFGGVQIGYNWQVRYFGPQFVLGVETDLQGAWVEGKDRELTTSPYSNGVAAASKLDWFGTFRGRLGYTVDRTLLYATGGFAYGGVNNSFVSTNLANSANFVSLRRDDTQIGYVIGGGLEHKMSPAWSVKLEYQYLDFGSQDYAGSYTLTGHRVVLSDVDQQYSTIRLGLNYKFW